MNKSSFFIIMFLILSITFISAEMFGYGNTETVSTASTSINISGGNYTFNETQFEVDDTNVSIKTSWLETFVNALSKWSNYWTKTENINQSGYNISADCLGVNGSQICSWDAVNQSVSENDPHWTANYSLYNDTWTSTYNSTYNSYNSTGLIKDWEYINTDTNASTACSDTEVLLGNGSCYNSSGFGSDVNLSNYRNLTNNDFYGETNILDYSILIVDEVCAVGYYSKFAISVSEDIIPNPMPIISSPGDYYLTWLNGSNQGEMFQITYTADFTDTWGIDRIGTLGSYSGFGDCFKIELFNSVGNINTEGNVNVNGDINVNGSANLSGGGEIYGEFNVYSNLDLGGYDLYANHTGTETFKISAYNKKSPSDRYTVQTDNSLDQVFGGISAKNSTDSNMYSVLYASPDSYLLDYDQSAIEGEWGLHPSYDVYNDSFQKGQAIKASVSYYDTGGSFPNENEADLDEGYAFTGFLSATAGSASINNFMFYNLDYSTPDMSSFNTAIGYYARNMSGLGATNTYSLYAENEVFVDANITAHNFVDLTPAWDKSSSEALDSLTSTKSLVKDDKVEIDHSTLPEFTRATKTILNKTNCKEICTKEISGYEGTKENPIPIYRNVCRQDCDMVPYEVEGRDIGATVTMLVESIKALKTQNEELKQELCLFNDYSWCLGVIKK
jgi:hypothetical protein